MKYIFEIQKNILDIIYPQTCGICGKINKKSICRKCEIILEKQAQFTVINEGKEIEDKNFNEIIYIFKYEGLIRNTIIDYKFNEKSYLYKTLVDFMIKNRKILQKINNYDIIIPVPISKKRQKERGYNQSLLIAEEISKKSNIQINKDCLIKTKNIIEQSKLNKEERNTNIQNVYELRNKEVFLDKKILLLDDIYTTGSTVNECSKILRQANPMQIGILVLAKD